VEEYPAHIEDELKKTCPGLLLINPDNLAGHIADRKFFNVALLGFIAPLLDISRPAWEEAITQTVPGPFLGQNMDVFVQGTNYYHTFTKEVTP
jgi:Pyruvate/2-oxoacid:ferredoxin oxidoreductase gamma subunit